MILMVRMIQSLSLLAVVFVWVGLVVKETRAGCL